MGFNTVTITNSAAEAVPANDKRQSLIIANVSTDTTIYIGPDNTVTSSNGTPIVQGGNLDEDAGGTRMYKGPFFAITASGTADLRYWEREGNI